MGLPTYEADVSYYRNIEEFNNAKAPYYGVNIIEVNNDNWDAFVERTKIIHQGVTDHYGGRSHLWTERDYGDRKLVLWINYYPESVGQFFTNEIYTGPARSWWYNYSSLVERWDWFIVNEDASSEAPL